MKESKGYRLKPSTHRLVNKLQLLLNRDQDYVITNALRMYYHFQLKNKR